MCACWHAKDQCRGGRSNSGMPAGRSLCFSRQPCFFTVRIECKIVQTITFLQAMFLASFLIMLYYEKEFIMHVSLS